MSNVLKLQGQFPIFSLFMLLQLHDVEKMSAESDVKETLRLLCGGLPVNPLPPARHRDETLPHAPTRLSLIHI